jgi:DNA-binding response OmpR family regulator
LLLCRRYSGQGRLVEATGGREGGLAMRVLVVEDERVLAAAVARGLREEAMAVDVSLDGADALAKLAVSDYDVVVLDRDLPEVHGDEVCRALVAGELGRARPPLLMLTAAGTVEERVDGLSLGADDYLPKPFAFSELVARVRALARRARDPLPPVLVRYDLVLDPGRREASRAGRRLDLSKKQFGVLEVLMSADGGVVSSEELLERAWDEHTDPFTNTVRVTVMRLRRKLGHPPLIDTVPGVGYRL